MMDFSGLGGTADAGFYLPFVVIECMFMEDVEIVLIIDII
jgi:hypothetical protein